MKYQFAKSVIVLTNEHERKAGEADFKGDGHIVRWGAAHQLWGIPLESDSDKIWKYTVAPECVEKISKKVANLSWGTLIHLELNGKYVTDFEVLTDWLSNYYESIN